MTWQDEIRAALERHRPPADADVVEELAQHAAASFEQARADGATTEEAHSRVSLLIESWCAAGAPRLRQRRTPIVEPPPDTATGWAGLTGDLRYGVRQMRRQPGFAVTAVLLVALGVGAATTLFTLAYSVLLKPLGWQDADRLVTVVETREGATRQTPNTFTNATYLAWHDSPSTITGLAAYASRTATITDGDAADRIRVVSATASVFAVLSAAPEQGALFTEADEALGRTHVVILSHGLWQQRFGGRLTAVGETMELDGERYRIAGVMPKGFMFPTSDAAAWIPLHVTPVLDPQNPDSRALSLFRGIAKLAPNATPSQASDEGTARGRAAPDLGMVGTAVFGTRGKPTITATSYLKAQTMDVRAALSILVAAVGLLLVVAIANIAAMQLSRAAARRREIAIRGALGASPARVTRQLLTENVLIGLAGGAVGAAIALLILRALPDLLPLDFPRRDAIGIDWRVFAISIAVGLLASAVFGVVPAVLARRTNLVEALVEDNLAPAGVGARSAVGRWRAALMTAQVAIAAMLLVGAVLLGRSFLAAVQADRGYNPSHVLTASLPMPDARFSGTRKAAVLDAIIDRAAHAPGVVAAAAGSSMPLLTYDQPTGFNWSSGPGHPLDQLVQTHVRSVSPGYFTALGVPVVEGRGLADTDSPTSQPVAVVNRAFARRYITGSPLGIQLPLSLDGVSDGHLEIVGVVDDVHPQTPTDPPQPELFTSYRQRADGMRMSAPAILIRTTGDPAMFAGSLREIVRQQGSALVLESVMPMEDRLLRSLARPRLYAVTLAAFAIFTLLVAGAGLYGVLSYSVAQRRRELGVRASLGASRLRILALVAKQGLAITSAGLVIGLVSAAMLARFTSSLLFGVNARDPLTFVLVPGVVCAVAALAILIPARQAVHIDPLIALKGD